MTKCTDCGRDISERARTCPACGAPGPAAGTITIGTSGPVPSGLQLASYGARAGAWLIDFAVVFIPVLLIALAFFTAASTGSEAAGLSIVPLFFLWIVVTILYKPLMEGWRGQTVGKMAVSIKVVGTEGSPCGYGKAFLRWLIGAIINVVPFGFLVDVLWPLWDERKQTLHDKVAATLVVRA